MIAVLDACTFINILQAASDCEAYFDWIETEFSRIQMAQVAVQEVHQRKHENLTEIEVGRSRRHDSIRDVIDKISFARTTRYRTAEDFSECVKVVQRATGYTKRNGEFYSVALGLYLSRMGDETRNDHLLSVLFATDDKKAREDFSEFVAINQVGQFIDSIDIATLLFLRGRITQADLSNFCLSLKALYSRSLAALKQKIEATRSLETKATTHNLLTEILEAIMTEDQAKFRGLKNRSEFKSVKKRHGTLFEDLETYMKEEPATQVAEIERRRQQMEHVWKL